MKYKIFSLGCKVNSYECAAIASKLENAGYVEDSNNPDVVIINTCSVTSTADQKSRQHIRKFQKLYPNVIIFVMGCYAQGNSEFIANEIQPTILIGTSNRDKVLDLIEQYKKEKQNIILVDSNPRKFEYEELGVTSCSENTRAYLKIQDGCNNFCTYCIIPYRRGKMRSRNKADVLEEARYLVNKGYKEIVISGIHVGGYGQDLGDVTFSELIDEISQIKGLNSLRISSIEESEIDEKLINLIKTRQNIANHLHIPLQSGSDTVLKRMNRKYTSEQFVNKITKIREEIPDVAITTDVIVGFPGETEKEFNDTLNVCKKCFDMLHVFPYSPRGGTPAATMKDQIDPKIKAERTNILIEESKKLYEAFASRFVGRSLNVLVEQFDGSQHANFGHTSNYIEVKIDSLESKVGCVETIILKKDMIVSK